MPEVRANLRVRKQMEVSIPPSVGVTRVVLSPRVEAGRLVFDINLPDGGEVKHQMKDGNYLYREKGNWWQATRVVANVATGPWIESTIDVHNLLGEWYGPLGDDNPEWLEATEDHMGRLLREFQVAH